MKTQLLIDFAAPKTTKSKKSTASVQCQICDLPIDLHLQSVRVLKACPYCGDRTWLLNLKTKEACVLYSTNAETLGSRLRDE